MKIGFCGTHCTGKTEKCHYLSDKYHWPIVTEVARKCPFPINKNTTRESQLWIWTTMIKKELEMSRQFQNIVCDRTLIDTLAYARNAKYDDLVSDLWAMTKHWMRTYDVVFYCRPFKDAGIVDDHFRDLDPLWRLAIDREVYRFIDTMGIPAVEIYDLEDLEEEMKNVYRPHN